MNVENCLTTVVFQGELAAVEYRKGIDQRIKTSTPSACTVITLFNHERKIAMMAHIDDYTSVRAAINKIESVIRRKFDTTLSSRQFTAKVMGGSDDEFSIQQNRSILEALEKLNIITEKIPLPPDRENGPQIAINPQNGEVEYYYLNDILNFNGGVEFQQGREYGEFNNFLDYKFGNSLGSEIPFFEIRETDRLETSIPNITCLTHRTKENIIDRGRLLERLGRIKLQIFPKRVVIGTEKDAREKVKKQILEKFSDCQRIIMSSKKEHNYDLMLRQSAVDPKYIKLFELLLQNSSALPLDLSSRGQKSGSVWDVAKKFNNIVALTLLNKM